MSFRSWIDAVSIRQAGCAAQRSIGSFRLLGSPISCNFPSLRHYTRGPDTFLGHAYNSAKAANRLMDWCEIIDAYDRFRCEDHSAVRALIQF